MARSAQGKTPPALRRYIYGLALLSLIFAAIIFHQLSLPHTDGGASDLLRPPGGDFLNYWAAPRIALYHIHDLFNPDHYRAALHGLYAAPVYDHNWSYPLHSLFFLTPFSAFNYETGFFVWVASGLLLYLAMLRIALPPYTRGLCTLAALLAPVTFIEIATGQNGFFLGAGALAVLLLMDRKRYVLAGIILGCLTVKPQLFLLWPVMLIACRAWKTITVACVTTAALLTLSLMAHGLSAWQEYLSAVPPQQWQLVKSATHEARDAIAAYHLMMPGLMVPLGLSGMAFSLALKVQFIASATIALATYICFRRHISPATKTLLLASGGLLVTPYAFNYDMTFFIAALLLQWTAQTPTSLPARWLHGAAFLLPLLVYKFNGFSTPLAPIILCIMFALAVKQALNSPKK